MYKREKNQWHYLSSLLPLSHTVHVTYKYHVYSVWTYTTLLKHSTKFSEFWNFHFRYLIFHSAITGRVATKISRNKISPNFHFVVLRNFWNNFAKFRETSYATKFREIRKLFSEICEISAKSFREISFWRNFVKFLSQN